MIRPECRHAGPPCSWRFRPTVVQGDAALDIDVEAQRVVGAGQVQILVTVDNAADLNWIEAPLEGATADDFSRQIHDLFDRLAHCWEVVTSPATGNPLYARPSVLVIYRKDREFLLKRVIPKPDETEGVYDLIVASQPYRARTSAERKVRLVLVPLARALASGGRMIVVHAHGHDPGLEIIRGVWPDEDPFQTGRAELLEEAQRQLTTPQDADLRYPEITDAEAIFRYDLHAMPTERTEHIGTGLTLAAWNAAASSKGVFSSRCPRDQTVYLISP